MVTDKILKDAVELRKYLHQYPELSGNEKNTSKYLHEKLLACAPDQVIRFDNYGLAVVFKGKEPGRSILIRSDFDALPIEEINDFDHRSRVEGVSHKCGHDGHTAILYALARFLSENPIAKGEAILLFQPAEENGKGAEGIISDPKFTELTVDFAVALHNLPGYPLHSLVYKSGPFTAAANSIIIKFYGKTSHAAEPEKGVNPAEAMAELTIAILSKNEPDLSSPDFKIATPVYTTMGERSYGVSAGYGELHFTLRSWSNEVIRSFEKECESIAFQVADKYDIPVKVEWTESFFANQNNTRVIEAVKRVGEQRKLEIINRESPFKWGEDFGIFTEQFRGAMFGLGSGEQCPALHNPDYDFPDELIQTGMAIFYHLISELQQNT